MKADHDLPREAFVAALLSLSQLGPARLAALLSTADADVCWTRLCSGGPIQVAGVSNERLQCWRVEARRIDIAQRWERTAELEVSASLRGEGDYPTRLLDDIEPPALLFRLGNPVPDLPTVAIVGTRKCTSYGRRVAHELSAALSGAGVSVVSGLALGIDAAAHHGALSVDGTPPIGVVGSGLDVIYPRRNERLWAEIARRGSLLSESPPGTEPEPWRFPARNRIIAGLADAVIVVESHASGGSLLTVDEAQLRDVPVGAIPGPVTSASSRGSNQLLADGAVPVLDVDDVLTMIGHVAPRRGLVPLDHSDCDSDTGSVESMILDAIGWTPKILEQLCLSVPHDRPRIAAAIEVLIGEGKCVRSGPWIERAG